MAIIGGKPQNFVDFVRTYRESAAAAGHDASKLPVAVTSHTYVADTSQQAATEFFPHYAGYMHGVSGGRFRVSPQSFDEGRRLDGALFVGSPAQVVEKILYQHELFGHQRFMAQISLGSVPHAAAMRALELLGEEVMPQVRRELADRGQATPAVVPAAVG